MTRFFATGSTLRRLRPHALPVLEWAVMDVPACRRLPCYCEDPISLQCKLLRLLLPPARAPRETSQQVLESNEILSYLPFVVVRDQHREKTGRHQEPPARQKLRAQIALQNSYKLSISPNCLAFFHEGIDAFISVHRFHQFMEINIFQFLQRFIDRPTASKVQSTPGKLERTPERSFKFEITSASFCSR